MSTLVHYTPEDRELDLANLTANDYELICSLHKKIIRGKKTLLCLQPSANPEEREMLIKERGGRYWAAHFPGGGHHCTYEVVAETDEHKRQKDYWLRAAEDAGYRASPELRTGRGTILDVAIYGPRLTGIEVQHSDIAVKAAKTRTTRSYNAGWLPVWFLDSDRQPEWMHRVPAVGCNKIAWGELPPRRAATAVGLSRFYPLQCRPGAFDHCPAGRKRACDDWHPARAPWNGITVDEVAAMVPAQQIVPMRDLKNNVHLVSPENLNLFQELTGHSGEYAPGNTSSGKGALRTTTCTNEVHHQPLPNVCSCGQEIYRLTHFIRERNDLCEGCRLKLGLPAPRVTC